MASSGGSFEPPDLFLELPMVNEDKSKRWERWRQGNIKREEGFDKLNRGKVISAYKIQINKLIKNNNNVDVENCNDSKAYVASPHKSQQKIKSFSFIVYIDIDLVFLGIVDAWWS